MEPIKIVYTDKFRSTTYVNRYVKSIKHILLNPLVVPKDFNPEDRPRFSLYNWSNGTSVKNIIDGETEFLIKKSEPISTRYLILDYDDGVMIEEFTRKYAEYEFYIYTSFNHQQMKKLKQPCDRFRVIIPLHEAIGCNGLLMISDLLVDEFKGIDPSCIKTIKQFQCMPIMKLGSIYRPIYNKGIKEMNLFELLRIQDEVKFFSTLETPKLKEPMNLGPIIYSENPIIAKIQKRDEYDHLQNYILAQQRKWTKNPLEFGKGYKTKQRLGLCCKYLYEHFRFELDKMIEVIESIWGELSNEVINFILNWRYNA